MTQPETDAIIAAYPSPPNQSHIDAIDAVIVKLKNTAATVGSVWDSTQALWVDGAPSPGAAKINWKAPGTFDQLWHEGSADGGLTHVADQGVKGTGLGFGGNVSYIDTQLDPTAGGLLFSQNDAGLFSFVVRAFGDSANDNYSTFNANKNASFALTPWRSSGGIWACRLFSGTIGFNSQPNSRTGGRSVERVGNQVSGWIDGIFDSTKTNTSAPTTNATLALLGGPNILCSPDTMGAAAIFRAIGAAGHVALYEAFIAYFTALGTWPPPPPEPPIFTGDAIDLVPTVEPSRGRAFLQNVTVANWEHLGLKDSGDLPLSGNAHYAQAITDPIMSLFGNGAGMVPLTPEFPFAEPAWYDSGDPSKWNVLAAPHSGSGLLDATAAIQAGFDSAAEVVVLPPGVYYINDTLLLRGVTKKFLSIAGRINILSNTSHNWNDPLNPRPIIRFTSTSTDCVIENFDGGNNTNVGIGGTLGFMVVEHASPKDLVIRDSASFQAVKYLGYRNTVAGTGKIFLHNTALGLIEIHNQKLFARNLNLEVSGLPIGSTRFLNDGGEAWVLNLKTEFKGLVCKAINASKTAIYGGFFYPNQAFASGDDPIFSIVDSQFSAQWIEMVFTADRTYQALVDETVSGVTRRLLKADAPARGSGSAVMLYSNV